MARKKKGLESPLDNPLVEEMKNRDLYGDDYNEQEDDPFISKVQPQDEGRPIVDPLFYITSLPETRKLFKEEGFSLDAVNAELELGSQLPIKNPLPVRRFFARVDTTKQDIETHIRSMHRKKAFKYTKDKKGKIIKTVGEFLYYHLELRGLDYLGVQMYTCIEYEGEAMTPKISARINFDPETGRDISERRFTAQCDKRYYIEFSKAKVDEILDKFKTDPATVKFYGFIPSSSYSLTEEFRYDGYTYKEFVTDWETFEDIARKWKTKREKAVLDKQQKGIA